MLHRNILAEVKTLHRVLTEGGRVGRIQSQLTPTDGQEPPHRCGDAASSWTRLLRDDRWPGSPLQSLKTSFNSTLQFTPELATEIRIPSCSWHQFLISFPSFGPIFLIIIPTLTQRQRRILTVLEEMSISATELKQCLNYTFVLFALNNLNSKSGYFPEILAAYWTFLSRYERKRVHHHHK